MREGSIWTPVFVAVSLWLSGCATPARGAITADGYQHNDYGYRVLPAKGGRLMGESWKLDNFYEATVEAEPGKPRRILKPKDAADYVIEYELDYDGDGEFETTVEELIYDLRFKHLVHDGVIFLRTVPVSTDMGQKKLSVLMDRFVERIAGAGYEVVSLNRESSLVVEKRYAAAVVSKGVTTLAGRDAYVAVLDVANIDQIKVDPNARRQRVELVLLHTDFEYGKKGVNQSARPDSFPVIMFVGYANVPSEFDAAAGEFHDFLARIEIAGKRGFEPPKTADGEKREAPEAKLESEDAPNAPETSPESDGGGERPTESPEEPAGSEPAAK